MNMYKVEIKVIKEENKKLRTALTTAEKNRQSVGKKLEVAKFQAEKKRLLLKSILRRSNF